MMRRSHLIGGLGLLAVGLLGLPFAGLILSTPWRHMGYARGDLASLWVSIGYTLIALLIIVVCGTPLAWWLARYRFRGKWLVNTLVLLPLLSPPLAMGLLLAISYGPYGWVGHPLQSIGLELTNTPTAFILAQVYASASYYIVSARAAFEGVPRDLEQIGLSLGRSPWRVFWTLTVPLAILGLATGIALAWVRALGEFGVILIVAYFPQGIPVKLWVDLQDIGLSATYPLLWTFFAVALPLPLALGLISRRQGVLMP